MRDIRKMKGLSQSDLAERVGVTQGYISHLETGRKEYPSIRVLSRIATTLDVALNELLVDYEKVG